MAKLVRTIALALLPLGPLVACGHLPFDELAAADDAGNRVDAGGTVDASGDGPERDRDGGRDGGDGGDGCEGPSCLGTFVSQAVGDDANPGTALKPTRTITRAMELAATLTGKKNVYVASGHYTEKVTLADGVNLLGGFQCAAAPCAWTRDIVKNDTAIFDTDFEGVLAPSTVTRKTLLDGFRVMGKSGVPQAAPGIAAITLVGGTPVITRCRIVGGDANGGVTFAKRSVAVAILGPPSDQGGAVIDGSELVGGASTDESVVVLFDGKPAGGGGGPSSAILTANTIRGGAAPFTSAILGRSSGLGTVLKNNLIVGGTSSNGGNNNGSWGVTVSSAMTIDGNRINTDASVGTCTQAGNGSFCGGILSQGATAIITNNVVLGPKGPRTCAILLTDSETPLGAVVLNANTLDGAGIGGADGTLSSAIVVRIAQGDSASMGMVRNNILLGGVNKNRYGVFEEAPAGKTAHLSVLEHNDFWNAGAPRNDFAYRLWSGTSSTDLTYAQLATLTTPVATSNIGVDPLLDASFHIAASSPCVDKGTATQAPARDIDGDNRPKGVAVDIGADEAK